MSVRIRLRRVGRKKQPYFRVVVAKRDAPRDGAYIEEVGFYNPRTRPALLTLDLEKVDAWVGKGAEVSESVTSLIRKARKGGDKDIQFVAPGEEMPRLKTATKPERRPTAAPPSPEGEGDAAEEAEAGGGEEAEGGAEVKAAVEPKAEESEAAETKTEAQAEAETESEATPEEAEEPAEEEEEEAEAPKAEAKKSPKKKAEAEESAESEEDAESDAAEEESEAEDEEED